MSDTPATVKRVGGLNMTLCPKCNVKWKKEHATQCVRCARLATWQRRRSGLPRAPKPVTVRCGQCRWRNPEGHCTCPKLYERDCQPPGEEPRGRDHLEYSFYEGGDFWVGEDFGCVHGEQRPA